MNRSVAARILSGAAAFGLSLLLATAASAAVNISKQATQNMSCSAGVCTATRQNALLNVADLANMLASGDVTVEAGELAKSIDIEAPLSWTAPSKLTLKAKRDLTIAAPVSVTGVGALTVACANGRFQFVKSGSVKFWDMSSKLVINGATYTLVRTLADLSAAVSAAPGGSFAFAADYDARSDGQRSASWVYDLEGKFEGLGHRISNITVFDVEDTVLGGLFETVGKNAEVENLVLRKVKVIGGGDWVEGSPVGGLAGASLGTIRNVKVSGRVYGTNPALAGGLVGQNSGTISGAAAETQVTSDEDVGGLVGYNRGIISNSTANARILKRGQNSIPGAGGLVGEDYQGEIISSTAQGTVTTRVAGNAGGLVGLGRYDRIWHSSASTTVYSGTNAGGFIGYLFSGSVRGSFATGAVYGGRSSGGFTSGLCSCIGNATIEDSYSRGSVTGGTGSEVGGFAGGTITGGITGRSYSTGAVFGGRDHGGFVGYDDNSGSVSQTYWNLDTSGVADPGDGAGNVANAAGITGLTDAQLTSALPAGFDPKVWGQNPNINDGYPYLLANPPPK